MADFRKWFLVLAAVLLLGAVTASAQPALTCSTNAGVPPILRAEGYTELAGDLVLNCTGGNPAQPFLANIQIFANTNITSKLLAGVPGYNEALLLIGEPNATTLSVRPVTNVPNVNDYLTYNAFRGQKVSDTAIAWTGVPIAPPGSNPANVLVIRMTNIRVDATRLLPAGATGGGLLPQQLIVYVSISGSTSVPVNNPQQVLGYVQQSMTFSVTNCNNTGDRSSAMGFNQCQGQGGDLFTLNRTVYSSGLGIRFTENFATAFRVKPAAQADSFAGQVVSTSENGFINSTKLGSETGFATNSTRLIAKWTNVPAGVRIFVATNNVVFTGKDSSGATNTYGGTKNTTATLLTGTDAYGNGGVAATPISQTSLLNIRFPGCGSSDSSVTVGGQSSGNIVQLSEVVLDANGNGISVWEVGNVDPNVIETVWIPIWIKYSFNGSSNLPALGTANVYGVLGPAYPATVSGANTATVDSLSGGLAYPRFQDAPPASVPKLLSINACVSNLLFPFVTNQAGFDTGIAIINTSRDPFDSSNANDGTCTINYYGKLADGSALTKTSETSSTIAAGSYLAFSLSGASNDPKVTGNPGFQGYIIAQCKFAYGHGYAFISDYGAQKLAHGYIALVMDLGQLNGSGRSGKSGEHLNN